MTDIAFSFNGSAIARTSSLGSVWTVMDYQFAPMQFSHGAKPVEVLDGAVEVGNSHPAIMRPWQVAVKATLSGVTGSTTERKGLAAWEELTDAFSPRLGVVKLQAASTHGATATSRFLWVETTTVPTFRAFSHQPQGLADSGFYEGDSGYIIYVVRGQTLFPYWQRSSLLTEDTSPATAQLDVSGSTDTVTVNNPGVRWVGCRFVVSNTAGGSCSSITLTNTTNGDVMVLSDASVFANSDYMDWFATDPRKLDRTNTDNRFSAAGKIRLSPGNNTIKSLRSGGAGTLTLSLSWPSLHYTF